MASRSLLAACLWLAALPAFSQGARFSYPEAGATLSAGDEVVVRWAGAPAAEEMELLLSVDGGRRFAVRLTRELPGNAATYVWRVPRLPSDKARLALRAKVHGHEIEVGESAPFAISSFASAKAPSEIDHPSGSIRIIDGELWWLERAVAGSEADAPALAGLESQPAGPFVLPDSNESNLAELPVPEGAPRPAVRARTMRPALLLSSCYTAASNLLEKRPLMSPLRI